MNFSRRNFLAAFAATMALDPERALFVPGKKLISIAKPRTLEIWPTAEDMRKLAKKFRELDLKMVEINRGWDPEFRAFMET